MKMLIWLVQFNDNDACFPVRGFTSKERAEDYLTSEKLDSDYEIVPVTVYE